MRRELLGLFLLGICLLVVFPAGLRGDVYDVAIGDFYFDPQNTVVAFGDVVRWTLIEGTHTTTSDPTSPKQWDSGTMNTPGQFFEVTFDVADGPGPFTYHCDFHPTAMTGTIFIDTCAHQTPGDTDSNGEIDLDDISYLIAYLYSDGPPPVPQSNGDPNGDCCIDSIDVNYLTDFIFGGGPPPVECTCIDPPICPDSCAYQLPGDVNHNGVPAEMADYIYLNNYLNEGGAPPPVMPNADVDGDCCISSLDLDYLLEFIQGTGPAPVECTCENPTQKPGDANSDGVFGAADVTFLLSYLATGGQEPAPRANGDPDGDCTISPADIAYLNAFLFFSGPPPVECTCIDPPDCYCYPGDADNNWILEVTDATYLISYVFVPGAPAPQPYPVCSGDADCNGIVEISDAVYLINYVFIPGSPAPCPCGVWSQMHGAP